MTYKTTAQKAQDELLDWANDLADRTRVAEQNAREATAVAKGAIQERDEALRSLAVLRMGARRQDESQAAQGAVTHGTEGDAA